MDEIMVSICCLVYNHEPYLRKCLDGFIMQKTNFKFEVLIHDDASTDGSADIIREYEQKYPDIIKPIYQTENQHSKGVSISWTFQFPRAKGKYIALCEGDDYWIDENKLQKQFNALETDTNCRMCIHTVEDITNSGGRKHTFHPRFPIHTGILCSERIINIALKYDNVFPFHTSSFFFLNDPVLCIEKCPSFMNVSPVGDVPLLLYYSSIGDVYFYNEVMSFYRNNVTGSATDSMRKANGKAKKRNYKRNILSLLEFDKFTNHRFHDSCMQAIFQEERKICTIDNDFTPLLHPSFKRCLNDLNWKEKYYILISAYFPKLMHIYQKFKDKRYGKQ